MATVATSCCNTLHLLPKRSHFRRLHSPPTRRLDLSPVARFAIRSAAARLGPKVKASSGPPPPLVETEEEEEIEEEETQWSGSEAESGDDSADEHEWAEDNGAARGEDLGADAGEDLSGWTRKSPRPRELFVCNLPRRCTDGDLLELFRPHGTVLSVEIKRDAETGISRGCAFVTMRSLVEARAAVDALDGFPQDLRELFTQFGTVVSTRLLTDRKGGRNRVYGFLSFSSAEELEAALKLDRTVFHGRDIIVKEAHVDR
ncbi:hypothetical protein PR202_ga30871 [Eleusine coracana subsp. coracana]|uniref:RRM domain-containing protein n=1 Tax=Eleusine coracana subsp. coracana TaxID=191504 RepID=A0AAV5DNJ2_ELECO|nr:hypothetical protein PR202_ga30871 [Eleusine coracana subsp. coracana]